MGDEVFMTFGGHCLAILVLPFLGQSEAYCWALGVV